MKGRAWFTWIAIILTTLGVTIIVGDGIAGGTFIGDLSSLGCAITLAYSIVRVRQSGKDLSLSPSFGGLFSGLFALPLVFVHSSWPGSMGWLLADTLILVPIAGFCLTLAPRFIPAVHVSMFFLLETVLAPDLGLAGLCGNPKPADADRRSDRVAGDLRP